MNKNPTHIIPRKRWSQNFLQDPNIARKIAGIIQLTAPSLLIEIGPGSGLLTRYLLDKCDQLLAVEIDPRLAAELPDRLDHPANLTVIQQDFLKWDLTTALKKYQGYQIGIIGNLPYHITSPILFRILDNASLFQTAVFMVQKEVARRLTAEAGNKDYGIISVFCQFYAQLKYLFTVPAHLFFPKPKVDSAVIQLNFRAAPEEQLHNPVLFRQLVRRTFGQRRKMLRNSLSTLYPGAILARLNVDLSRRPESLSVQEFMDLSNQLQPILEKMEDAPPDPRH
jgi:16S rRNA (adenine1518-N6/adenine1519-N6)-dimethyltransferase